VIAFRSPMPAELAALAGSTREAEAAWQVGDQELTGRQTITMRSRARVERTRIIRTTVPDAAREQAKGPNRALRCRASSDGRQSGATGP
jgi:hypothetical protein